MHDSLKINVSLVKKLIKEQFPQWSDFAINPVELSGFDNRTFHLGTKMSIRLPSAQSYAAQVQKEQRWLPLLSPHVSCTIPQPIAMGNPSENYPWNWSIYSWIEGKSANTLSDHDMNLQKIAMDLAHFINELHTIDTTNGPLPGPHNYYRGGPLAIYDVETRNAINQLPDLIDTNAAISLWNKALDAQWNKKPVWVHGDFSAGNILIKNNQLNAVIDFGCMGIGDPACDLTIAWTLLTSDSRKTFKSHVNIDSDTWARARGWALWKSLITITQLQNKSCPQISRQLKIINEISHEHTTENI